MGNSTAEKDDLPRGWLQTKLGEVCEILDSQRIPINSDERAKRIIGKSKNELFPYYGATGLVGYIDDFLFDGEYVLLGEDGAPFLESYKDKAYLVKGKFWVNNHAHILDALFSKKYLCHYLNQIDYREFVTGTTRLKLNQASMKEIPIILPSLPEQHRIVAKIEELFSELDKGVEALKTAQQQLKVYRQAVLQRAFEGKLTEEWRKQQKDLPTASQLLEQIKAELEMLARATGKKLKPMASSSEAELAKLPNGWQWVNLADVSTDIFDGPFGSHLKSSDYTDDGVRVIRLENIGALEFNDQFRSYVAKEKYETIKKHTVYSDDIVFSSFISEKIRVALVPSHIQKAVNKADCFCIRTNKTIIGEKYLACFLSTRAAYHQLVNEIHGATRPRINTTQLKSCWIPYCSVEEQHQIVAEIESRLSVADKIEESIAQSLKQAEALRQSILRRAFSGKLVPQDPNDEPAEKLLARIRAKKAMQTQENGTVKRRGARRKTASSQSAAGER